MKRLILLLVVAAAFAGPRDLRADERDVAAARALLDDLRYDEARQALETALERGDSDPDAAAAIYLLLGEIDAASGDPDAARGHFRRALSLDPDATLPPGVSPKLSQPFAEARESLPPGGSLAASVRRDGEALLVQIEADPAELVAGASAVLADGELVRAGGGDTVRLAVPGDAEVASLALVDSHGNRLLELEPPTAEAAAAVTAPPEPSAPSDDRSLLGRWQLWGAVAVGFAAGGTFAGLNAQSKASEAESLEDGTEYADALALEEAAERRARYANLAFAAAGACAVTGAILYWRDRRQPEQRRARAAITPVVSADGIGVAASLRF